MINEQIRDKEIRLIGEDGEQLGIMSAKDALKMAKEAELDLVKIAPTAKPPVCKIVDYGKYRYEQARKDFLGFIDLFRFAISKEVPDIAESIMYMEPKEWMYRIARDMRFHKNGPPYNPAFRAYIASDRKSWRDPVGAGISGTVCICGYRTYRYCIQIVL